MEQYKEFIAGLIDSDGYMQMGNLCFLNKNKAMVTKLALLCSSIGIKTRYNVVKTMYKGSYRYYSALRFYEMPFELPIQCTNKKEYKVGLSKSSIGWTLDKEYIDTLYKDAIRRKLPQSIKETLYNQKKYCRKLSAYRDWETDRKSVV